VAVPVNIGVVAVAPRSGRRTDARVASGFLAPSMLGLLAFTAFPIFASLLLGFYNWPVIGTYTFTGLKNYQTLLTSDQYPFLRWIKNSLILATVNSAFALLMGACAAYAFSRMRFAGRRMGMLGLMLVQMFPAVLGITAVYYLLSRIADVFPTFGIGSIWGTLLIYLGGALGVNTFLMKGYFDTIPVDLDESARIDGAGHFRVFADLIMRLALPILVVVFFVSFQSTFNELPIAQVTLSDQQDTTAAVGLNSLVSNPLIQEWGLMAAGGVMMSIPLFTLFLLTQKSLVTGLTAGAVKG